MRVRLEILFQLWVGGCGRFRGEYAVDLEPVILDCNNHNN